SRVPLLAPNADTVLPAPTYAAPPVTTTSELNDVLGKAAVHATPSWPTFACVTDLSSSSAPVWPALPWNCAQPVDAWACTWAAAGLTAPMTAMVLAAVSTRSQASLRRPDPAIITSLAG